MQAAPAALMRRQHTDADPGQSDSGALKSFLASISFETSNVLRIELVEPRLEPLHFRFVPHVRGGAVLAATVRDPVARPANRVYAQVACVRGSAERT